MILDTNKHETILDINAVVKQEEFDKDTFSNLSHQFEEQVYMIKRFAVSLHQPNEFIYDSDITELKPEEAKDLLDRDPKNIKNIEEFKEMVNEAVKNQIASTETDFNLFLSNYINFYYPNASEEEKRKIFEDTKTKMLDSNMVENSEDNQAE